MQLTGTNGSNTLEGGAGADLIYGFDPDGPQGNVSSIAATRVAAGLSQPLFAASPPDDLGRLFIVEKTESNTLRVTGNRDDSAEIGTGWTQGADQVIGQNTYHSYTQNLATLLVDSDIVISLS